MGLIDRLRKYEEKFMKERVIEDDFAPSEVIREHIIFQGTVQHVGFRFEAMGIAHQLRLTGWVKNLSSGDVEMEVQGEKEKIARMISELGKVKRFHLENVEIEVIPNIIEKDFQAIY